MDIIPNWLLVFPILGFLVFVHELGHFITAKRFGIKVTEFGFGFPPKIIGFTRGDTLYSLNLIPLGGFVKMIGEEDPTDLRSFARQNTLKKSLVLIAGPFMNLLIPIIIFTALLVLPHDSISGDIKVSAVAPNSPAQQAGIANGDTITFINDTPVKNPAELLSEIKESLGKETYLTIKKSVSTGGLSVSPDYVSTEILSIVPRNTPPYLIVVETVTNPNTEITLNQARRYIGTAEVGDILTQGALGILISTDNIIKTTTTLSIWEAVPRSITKIIEVISATLGSLAGWVSDSKNPGFTGPVGIAQVTGEVAQMGIGPIFELTALLSISLAILNILPIPALDGGRLLFVLIEGLRGGKKINPKTEGLIHMVGFGFLIGLIIIMSYFDIVRVFTGGNVLQ
jgi:regulator of sigma E protease